jgi:hypothetical protein
LTLQRPSLTGPKEEPVLPEGVPSEFLPIVHACLRPDPRRRATIDEVVELLAHPRPSAPERSVEPAAHAPRKSVRYVLAGASVVALAGILAGPRLLRRPVANAQIEHAVITPAFVPVSTTTESPQPEAAKPAKPTPFVPARDETPAPPVAPPASTVPLPNVAERAAESSPGDVVHQVMPDVLDAARRTIRGKVKIQVRAAVDAAGHVTDANVESENSRYFARLSLQAARQWEFASGPGDYILRFEFTTAGSTVRPSRVAR